MEVGGWSKVADLGWAEYCHHFTIINILRQGSSIALRQSQDLKKLESEFAAVSIRNLVVGVVTRRC